MVALDGYVYRGWWQGHVQVHIDTATKIVTLSDLPRYPRSPALVLTRATYRKERVNKSERMILTLQQKTTDPGVNEPGDQGQ